MKTNREDFIINQTDNGHKVTYRSPKTRLTWTKIVKDKDLINRALAGDSAALDELKKLVKTR